MRYENREAILRALKLDPKRDILAKKSRYRQTGRTTAMLVDALEILNEKQPDGEVLILANSVNYGRNLTTQLKRWLNQLDIKAKTIRYQAANDPQLYYKLRGLNLPILQDHFSGPSIYFEYLKPDFSQVRE